VLSDRAFVKPNDAKTLDLADEQWRLIEDMLPLLQPLQNVTALFSQENAPSSSVVYPSLWKLIQVDMAASDDDTPAVAGFKAAITASLKERFDMTSLQVARHPFVIATVLDPEYKAMTHFPDNVRAAAYEFVREQAATMPLPPPVQLAATTEGAAGPAQSQPPPAKRAKVDTTGKDSREAAQRFMGAAAVEPAAPVCDVDNYLSTLQSTPDGGLLEWWRDHLNDFPQTSELARRYLAIPATSAQSERLFSATGRIVNKLRTRLLPERVESLVFLYKNM